MEQDDSDLLGSVCLPPSSRPLPDNVCKKLHILGVFESQYVILNALQHHVAHSQVVLFVARSVFCD
jgi:hypothetical protein